MNLGDVSEKVRRYTVQVQVAGRGGGSGIIVGSTGLIVTNAHVAQNANPQVELWDGRRFPAKLAALARRHDLALLKVDTLGLPEAVLADSSSLRPGELVFAVGNPMGFVGALSTGVVHAVGPMNGLGRQHWVQAAIRLAPGNSGGPLADARGRVIGVNTMIAGGLALAIPGELTAMFVRKACDQVRAVRGAA